MSAPRIGRIDSNYAPNPGAVIDTESRPQWRRTGNKYFPYAAHQCGRWWVLRRNFGFPEHDEYTLFVDGQAAADITANPDSPVPLLASIGALQPTNPDAPIPALDGDTAVGVVSAVGDYADYADYGSEYGDPCVFCFTRL